MGIVSANRRQLLRGGLAVAGLGLLSGCGLPVVPWPPSQPARIAWLGLLRSDDPAFLGLLEAFRHGLHEPGWVEGQSYAFDFRFAEGRLEQLPALAADLVRARPDVLVVGGGLPTLQAAQAATSTIPIVVPSYSGDPAADGLVASLARPGGNLTGLSNNTQELGGKRLELLKEAVPGLSRVAVFRNAASPTPAVEWRETQAAAQVLGVSLLAPAVRGPDDLAGAFDAAVAAAQEALIVLQDVIFYAHRARITELAATHRLPAM